MTIYGSNPDNYLEFPEELSPEEIIQQARAEYWEVRFLVWLQLVAKPSDLD